MINRIRPFVFETNSSLTNALILFDKDMYEKWDKDCNLYINIWENDNPVKVYTKQEAIKDFVESYELPPGEEITDDELASEGYVNNNTIYEEGYSIEKLDLDVIGQDYVVVSACKEDR